jgi:pimeloyl-ACP methyl ester carboxylesterase
MVADTKGLIEALDAAPCRIVGVSLGALIAQELAIGWPHLVRCAVSIATKARSDATRSAHAAAYRSLAEAGVKLPPDYAAAMSAFMLLSPTSLNDDVAVSMWLESFRTAPGKGTARGQSFAEDSRDRREALRKVTAPCRVIAFADDLITPPHLAAEVADAIPDCDYVEIQSCGHLGYLERPEEVNAAIIEFLDKN